MNENSPTMRHTVHGLTAEQISRRAYELWEQEGRPENRDLHHWLRAEQELLQEQAGSAATSEQERRDVPATDTQPLQGTRAAAASSREPRTGKRGSASPFGAEKSPANRTNGGARSGGRL